MVRSSRDFNSVGVIVAIAASWAGSLNLLLSQCAILWQPETVHVQLLLASWRGSLAVEQCTACHKITQ